MSTRECFDNVIAALGVAVVIFLLFLSYARAHDPKHHEPNPPLGDALNKSGGLCCNGQDYTIADAWERTKDGKYRVRLGEEWHDVPDSACVANVKNPYTLHRSYRLDIPIPRRRSGRHRNSMLQGKYCDLGGWNKQQRRRADAHVHARVSLVHPVLRRVCVVGNKYHYASFRSRVGGENDAHTGDRTSCQNPQQP